MTTVPTRRDAMVKMPGVCDLFCEYEARDIVRHLQTLDARVCSYEKGEYVLHYGDPVDTAVIIVSGSLHSVHEMPTGETCVIRTLRVGYLAGAISLIVPQPRHLYSLYAPERTQVVTLSAKKTIAWRKDPESASFFRAIELQLFTYMQDMSRKCVVVSQPSVEKRIMTYLGIRCHEESAKTITVPGTEAEFASYLCAHPISVSRALNKLRNEGKIDYNRNVLTLLTPPPIRYFPNFSVC